MALTDVLRIVEVLLSLQSTIIETLEKVGEFSEYNGLIMDIFINNRRTRAAYTTTYYLKVRYEILVHFKFDQHQFDPHHLFIFRKR